MIYDRYAYALTFPRDDPAAPLIDWHDRRETKTPRTLRARFTTGHRAADDVR